MHTEPAFNNRQMIAEPKDEQKVTSGLLVKLLSDEEGIKYVQSKLHITIGLLQKSLRTLLEIALPICEAGFLTTDATTAFSRNGIVVSRS